nr:sensor histidine kinase [uncultured Rhodoferax sp.]
MKPDIAKFKVESALLEELGERLVSSPEVALIELVKNSYDADATVCRVKFSSQEIVVQDDGNGMRVDDFLNLWMVIGTRNKARNGLSQKYSRKVSGSKGIGRFAARFLGSKMVLKTIAIDSGKKRELLATFDWDLVEGYGDLQSVTVPYTVKDVGPGTVTGTTLTISRLRSAIDLDASKTVYSKLLGLVNPIVGFEKPPFAPNGADPKKLEADPGFTPYVGEKDAESDDDSIESPAEKILSAYVARARIEILPSGVVTVDVTWDKGQKSVYSLESSLQNLYGVKSIGTPALIDIRYFPLRGGVMTSLGVNGKVARSWLTDNCGVRVVDNGFRITPYGDPDDDWLKQSSDKAKSARTEWRSIPMVEQFSIADKALSPRDNPMLYLPGNNQAFGLVSLATAGAKKSQQSKSKVKSTVEPDQVLTPSMDRQGFVNNKAFQVLRDLSRFGIELIAYFDHKQVREEQDRNEEEALRTAEADLKTALKDIRQSKTIEPQERERLTALLRNASVNYAEVDTYRKKTQDSLEIMSLMGVLAGFMTHEFEKTLYRLSEATKTIRKLSKKHPELKDDLGGLETSQGYLETYLDYSRLFTENLSNSKHAPFPARAQIELVLDTLAPIAKKNSITFDIQALDDTEAPAVPVAAYSGVLLNLVTNAMKSLIARSDGEKRMVRIVVSNTPTKHKLIVADNGIGIPERLRDRIWEPLFSTTPRGDNPLGTGMGLGLALVKRVTTNMKGKVDLMKNTPAGYSTAFSVELPRS